MCECEGILRIKEKVGKVILSLCFLFISQDGSERQRDGRSHFELMGRGWDTVEWGSVGGGSTDLHI